MLACNPAEGLVLRGQMIHDADADVVFFLGSPKVSNLEQLTSFGLSLSDLAPHDALGDLLVALQTKQIALSDAQEIAGKLVKSEARFRELIRASTDIVAILDTDSVVKYVSPAVESILGISPAEIIGNSLVEYINEEDGLKLNWTLSQLVEEPLRLHHQQFRWRSRRNTWVTLEAVFRNALGNPYIAGIVVNARDVSQKEELTQQLLQSRKLDVLGQLAGGIAHDFNNLLFVINNCAEFLREDTPVSHPHHADLGEIIKAAEQAASLTTQILLFSSKRVLAVSVVDISVAGRDQEEILRRLVPPEIDLRFQYGEDLDHVKVDIAQFSQALVNLVINARNAIAESGTITIDFENRDLPIDTADHLGTFLSAGHYVVCSVTDTGSGMSEEVLEHAFDPFFTTNEIGQGTGLGLATIYGMVKQHDGGVFVASEVGRGTHVSIWLPRSSELPTNAAIEAASEPLRGGTERILVVDDAAPVLTLVERGLGAHGYKVTAEQYAESALRRFPSESFDLVITDILMPGMTGPEFAKEVQKRAPGTPILFISAYAEDKSLRPIAGTKFPILPKPFSNSTLARWVRQILDGKDPFAATEQGEPQATA
jgi:PAS domain S-box-containing protein